MSNPSVIVKLFDEEVQKMCDEAFERGLKAGQEKQFDAAFNEAVDPEKYDVKCEIHFDVRCDKELTENLAIQACYQALLDAAIKFGREQGLAYCDIEYDLSDAYDKSVEQEVA